MFISQVSTAQISVEDGETISLPADIVRLAIAFYIYIDLYISYFCFMTADYVFIFNEFGPYFCYHCSLLLNIWSGKREVVRLISRICPDPLRD